MNRLSKLQGTILKLIFLCLGLVSCLYLFLNYELVGDFILLKKKKRCSLMTLPNAGLKGRHSTVVPSRGAAFTQVHSPAGEAGT